MSRVWRLQRSVYPVLDGEGARRFDGRWNRPGRAVVYTSENLALCVPELLVQLDTDLVPDDYAAYELDVPESCAMETIDEDVLPPTWRRDATCAACQDLGDTWLEAGRTAILSVPSAVLSSGKNILLNPNHPDMKRIRLVDQEPFAFDPRLIR